MSPDPDRDSLAGELPSLESAGGLTSEELRLEELEAQFGLTEAEAGFDRRDLPHLAERCRELRKESQPNPWVAAGITAREADVLHLVGAGLPNKEIAARLHLSPRTVEKHVESLLRKTGARSRTGLMAAAAQAATRDSQRGSPPPGPTT